MRDINLLDKVLDNCRREELTPVKSLYVCLLHLHGLQRPTDRFNESLTEEMNAWMRRWGRGRNAAITWRGLRKWADSFQGFDLILLTIPEAFLRAVRAGWANDGKGDRVIDMPSFGKVTKDGIKEL